MQNLKFKITALFFLLALMAGCQQSNSEILKAKEIENKSDYELINETINNPVYSIGEVSIEIDENDDLNIKADDQKSVYVEKVLNTQEIIVSFMATVDSEPIIKLKRVKLAGINDTLSECEEDLIFKKLKEVMENQYVYFDSDSKDKSLKYILIWKEDLQEPDILSFFTQKEPQDQIQLNFSLVRIGYSKPASYHYDLEEKFQESQRVAKSFEKGIWGQCSDAEAQPKAEKKINLKEDDLNGFLLGFQEAYCGLKKLQYEFWSDYYSDKYTKIISKDRTDIPTMNILGKTSLDRIKIYNMDSWISSFDKFDSKKDFSEGIRLLNLAYGFLTDYFEGSSNLKNFEEFKTEASPKLFSYNETIEQIPSAISGGYEYVISEDKMLDTPVSRSASNIEALCDLAMSVRMENDKSIENAQAKQKETFLTLSDTSNLTRASNNAYYVYGTTSDNCSKITVEFSNGNLYDSYQLKTYKYGDISFRYGIREDWDNLSYGTNTYTFKAYCDFDRVKEASVNLNYSSVVNYETPNSYYTGSTGVGRTFHGYECTQDCSGHEAGYEWAEDKGIYDPDDCGGNSNSFIEGCRAYAEEHSRGDVYVYNDCEEGSYCYGEDQYGNELEIYVYDMEDGYGYGEDDYGNEVEFYYDD